MESKSTKTKSNSSKAQKKPTAAVQKAQKQPAAESSVKSKNSEPKPLKVKEEKTPKVNATKSVKAAKKQTAKEKFAAFFKRMADKWKALNARGKTIVVAIILASVLGTSGVVSMSVAINNAVINSRAFALSYPTDARHGYKTEYLGEVKRKIPTEVKNEGMALQYPKYGYTAGLLNDENKRQQLIDENSMLCSNITSNGPGDYNKMDKEGNLYLVSRVNGELVETQLKYDDGTNRKLYKHTGAVGLYYGDVSDSEPAVKKRITFSDRGYRSYSLTGLYAPAGEIIKVEVSGEDLEAAGGSIVIHIGQALYNGQANNIWSAKSMNRMPVILNTMAVGKDTSEYDADRDVYTCYIGSFLGGPIYVRNVSNSFTLTISGAVNYKHFILGHTTESEYKMLSKSSVPFFDLEVWEYGVLQSGPAKYANINYEEAYMAATYWQKVSELSSKRASQGVVFLYDCFVAAGAAVAFPGRQSCNCPASWMANALSYKTMITSGSWGVMHEYNHNFQGYGFAGGGEVTNNALNLAAYAAYTKISSGRTLTATGEGGLSGWNAYTNASWALNRVLNRQYGGTNQLSIYSTMIHNLGVEDFVLSTKGGGLANYFNAVVNQTGLDMTYFFTELINQDPGSSAIEAVRALDLPMFVPVSSIYQTGRSLTDANGQKRYIKSMRPFVITYGESYDIDLSRYTKEGGFYRSGTIVLPEGFSYEITKITQPKYGKIELIDGQRYRYIPSKKNLESGEIKVTLKITKDDHAFEVEDVDLILEFEQTHERNKSVLERTVYTYENNPFLKASEAWNNNFAGYITSHVENNINPVQNSNSEIWIPNPSNNAVMVVSGKLYIPSSGNYRIALRGRHQAALYVSLDGGKSYDLAAELDHNTNNNGWQIDETENTGYTDLLELRAGQWVYFKAVLLVNYSGAFIGVGIGKFESPGSYNEDKIFVDTNGNPIDEDSPLIVTVGYANAYRSSYEFDNRVFVAPDLFGRVYNSTYKGEYLEKGKLVSVSGYTPWPGHSDTLDELFDENDENYIHSAKGSDYFISEAHPFEMTVDLKMGYVANRMNIYGPKQLYTPTKLRLFVGMTVEDMHEVKIAKIENKDHNAYVTFEKEEEFRFYKMIVTDTYSATKYIGMRFIRFALTLDGRFINPASSEVSYKGKWSLKNEVSSFGNLYVGQKGASFSFTFEGEYLVINNFLTKKAGKFEVYIDGRREAIIEIKSSEKLTLTSYFSRKLKNKKHSVVIKVKKAIAFDSFMAL